MGELIVKYGNEVNRAARRLTTSELRILFVANLLAPANEEKADTTSTQEFSPLTQENSVQKSASLLKSEQLKTLTFNTRVFSADAGKLCAERSLSCFRFQQPSTHLFFRKKDSGFATR